MSSTQDKATAVNPNADVIAGLREAADWLEAHPELYRARGLISFHPWGDECRPALTALAAALGERANEHVERERVFIEASFSERVRVSGDALVEQLGGVAPAKPVYETIIKPEFSVRIGAPAAGARQ